MTTNTAAIEWYEANAVEMSKRYEGINADRLNGWMLRFLPTGTSSVLDVGAGSGRDAAWLARKGLRVTAVEPAKAMMAEGKARHPNGIQWEDDALPALSGLEEGTRFDMVVLSAVWMHVPPAEREQAFARLVELTVPRGVIAMTFITQGVPANRAMYPVTSAEVVELAGAHRTNVAFHAKDRDDLMGRSDVEWTLVALRMPDEAVV